MDLERETRVGGFLSPKEMFDEYKMERLINAELKLSEMLDERDYKEMINFLYELGGDQCY